MDSGRIPRSYYNTAFAHENDVYSIETTQRGDNLYLPDDGRDYSDDGRYHSNRLNTPNRSFGGQYNEGFHTEEPRYDEIDRHPPSRSNPVAYDGTPTTLQDSQISYRSPQSRGNGNDEDYRNKPGETTRNEPETSRWTSNQDFSNRIYDAQLSADGKHSVPVRTPVSGINEPAHFIPWNVSNGREDYPTADNMIPKQAWTDNGYNKSGGKFFTMKNAKEIAGQLGMQDAMEDADRDSLLNETEHRFKNLRRKCWGKICWSTTFHSHVVRRNGMRTRLQQTPVSPATGLSALELNKQKARKRITETYKDVTGRLFIWAQAMKTIEGRYGTGVVSYFIFLRWLLLLNLFIFTLVFTFVVLPQTIARHQPGFNDSLTDETSYFYSLPKKDFLSDRSTILYEGSKVLAPMELRYHPYADTTAVIDPPTTTASPLTLGEISDQCSKKYKEAVKNRTRTGIEGVQDLLQGTGFMEITALFPGWYSPAVRNILDDKQPYNLSLAYIFVTLAYFLVCLVMMVIYTSEGVHETLRSSEGQLHKYCNLVFGGWDYCIEERKTAIRKHQSITQELKSTLFEKRRIAEISKWSRKTKCMVFLTRCLLHLIVIAILAGAGYLIFIVCEKTLELNQDKVESNDFSSLFMEFLPSITITGLNIVLPIVFTQLTKLERYSVAFTIKITLVRTVFVRLASVGVLVWTFYVQFTCSDKDRDSQCKYCMTVGDVNKIVSRCWETYVGQQLYKLVVLDFIVVLITTFLVDFPRRLIYANCSCKLAKLAGPLEFDIPKHVLDLVYSQTLCWLGTFYSPLLPAVCVLKYIVFFYLKKLTLLVNCSPSQIPYRASRSNTFFMIVLMLSFVLSVIPVGYTIAKIPPSTGCGPFRGYNFNMWDPVSHAIKSSGSPALQDTLGYLASAGFAVPVFVILCLLIYYYLTVSSAHKEMIHVLKDQLVLEGKDKQFLLARLTEDARQRLRSGGSFG